MGRPVRRSALVVVALAALALIPAVAWSQKLLEPHMPGWERWFKLDWETGEYRGHPVVKGYLYNASPKTLLDVQLLVDALDSTGAILSQKVEWVPGSTMEPFSRRYFVAAVPPVAIAPQQPAQYRVRIFSFTESQAPAQRH